MECKIMTIGVYGSSERAFFKTLTNAGIDTFCDIRARRGVRGSEYAFVNSKRLQARLAEMGIRYIHRRDLAPSKALRIQQSEHDRAERIKKRDRLGLSPGFVTDYREECLTDFDSQAFLDSLGQEAQVIVFFCVEREAAACHRSLLTERLSQDLGLSVEHIVI